MNRNQLVSVIITTKNEEDRIARLINSILKQTYQNREIILVDNNSTDKTIEIAKKLGAKIYNFGPERSAQRNYGAEKSSGNYLLFLDADMELSPNVLKECIQMCEYDQNIGGIIIPEESKAGNFWERVKAFERSFYNKQGDEATDAARFFKKEAFRKSGGFDETITGPEDWDLTDSLKKKGYKTGRIKAVIYHYEKINSLLSLAYKKFYYALRSYRYLSKQNVPVVSQKTIYFLRPVFYKNIDKIISHPILATGMVVMLTLELLAGGLGYLVGKVKKL